MPPSPVVADEEVLPIQIVDLFSSRDLARPGGPPSCEGVSAHEYYHAWSWFSQSHSPSGWAETYPPTPHSSSGSTRPISAPGTA